MHRLCTTSASAAPQHKMADNVDLELMARALFPKPEVVLLDEPTKSLMSSMIARIRETGATLSNSEAPVLPVEPPIDGVLSIAHSVALFENGRSRESVDNEIVRAGPTLPQCYLSVGF